jgi:hypothetical protein
MGTGVDWNNAITIYHSGNFILTGEGMHSGKQNELIADKLGLSLLKIDCILPIV